jgi:hypothetical protein
VSALEITARALYAWDLRRYAGIDVPDFSLLNDGGKEQYREQASAVLDAIHFENVLRGAQELLDSMDVLDEMGIL